MKDTDSFFVRVCNCGVIHLCFGATTLNLSEGALVAVTETLKEVSAEIVSKRKLEFSELRSEEKQAEDNVILGKFLNLRQE